MLTKKNRKLYNNFFFAVLKKGKNMKKTDISKLLSLSLAALICFTGCKPVGGTSSQTPTSSETPVSSQAPVSSETPVSS